MYLSVIIPAYNEEGSIRLAIQKIVEYFNSQKFDFEIIVIDDGSQDGTADIIREEQEKHQNLVLLQNETNRGKGFSVRRGALQSQGEWILFLDADLSTNPQEFEKFKSFMSTHDIVIGSRAVRGVRILKRQPFFRELLGKLANKIIRLVLGLSYHDTQCGFKLFSTKVKVLFQEQRLDRWLFDAELLYLAKRHGFSVKEAPITWSDDPTTTVKTTDVWTTFRDLFLIKKIHG